jgi:hypothetical protein
MIYSKSLSVVIPPATPANSALPLETICDPSITEKTNTMNAAKAPITT